VELDRRQAWTAIDAERQSLAWFEAKKFNNEETKERRIGIWAVFVPWLLRCEKVFMPGVSRGGALK
jgi:hypothetical protein